MLEVLKFLFSSPCVWIGFTIWLLVVAAALEGLFTGVVRVIHHCRKGKEE